MKTGITGIDDVMNKLNLDLAKIKGKTAAGFIEVAILIRNDMENQVPYIPLDLGNLRASWFSVITGVPPISSPGFRGRNASEKKQAAEMAVDHAATVASAKGAVDTAVLEPSMIMGFTANYAIEVHERYDPEVEWSKPGSGPGFFQASLNRNENKIVPIIKNKI